MGSRTAFRFWRFNASHRWLKHALALLVATQSITLLLAQSPLILKQFQDTKWEAPYESWRAAHPAAKCRPFDGTGFGADEQWCYRCVESAGAENYESSFY